MRVVWLDRFGEPEVLRPGEAPDPVPGPGQVLVRAVFVNTTFVETQFRAGGMNPWRAEPPVIPGNGVGGVVTAVGDGVSAELVGARVVTATGGLGAYAEQVVVAASAPIVVPDGLGLDEAVALLADGRTAHLLLSIAEVRAGERVLVEAAAGGVGSLLVQLLKGAGATVVAAAGGARKVAAASDVGADAAVDYSRPGWASSVGAVDVVFDGVGGDIGSAAFTLLRPGGRFVTYGLASGTWAPVTDEDAAARGVTVRRGATASPDELRALTERALDDAASGELRPVIGARYPLAAAAEAHRAMENRATIGKTLLVV